MVATWRAWLSMIRRSQATQLSVWRSPRNWPLGPRKAKVVSLRRRLCWTIRPASRPSLSRTSTELFVAPTGRIRVSTTACLSSTSSTTSFLVWSRTTIDLSPGVGRGAAGAARRSIPALLPSGRSTERSDQRRPRSVNRSTTSTSSSRSALRCRPSPNGPAGLVQAVLVAVAHVRRPPVPVEEAQLMAAVGILPPSLDLALPLHLRHTASVGREAAPALGFGRIGQRSRAVRTG